MKLQAGKNTSFLIGALPTLMGAEYTFSFENMNIERGLLWNQENAVNRGIQVNQTMGKFTASLSWNDGFYSNRYSWLSGSLTYANGPHSLGVRGRWETWGRQSFRPWPHPCKTTAACTPSSTRIQRGLDHPALLSIQQSANQPGDRHREGRVDQGGAILVSHTFKHGFSLPVRWEYIASSGSAPEQAVNLLFGPGSAGTSFTVTPTFQYERFFFRGDLSWVHASNSTPGAVFGPTGVNNNQPRAVGEIGFMF